jgi:predicted PurR-regulated permease PerM
MHKLFPVFFPPLFLVLCGASLLVGLGDALVPLLVAAFLAYLFFPVIRKLEEKGVKRAWAIALLALLAMGGGGALIALLLPVLIEDFRSLVSAFPSLAEAAIHKAEGIAQRFGWRLPLGKEELIAQAKAQLSAVSGESWKAVGIFFTRAFSGFVGVLLAMLNFLLIPIFFLYLVADYERLAGGVNRLLPPAYRPYGQSLAVRSNEILRAYFRGQLLVSLMLGVLYGTGFWIAGLRFGFVLGLLTGLLNLIPIVGPLLGIGIATAVTLADFEGYGTLAGAWGVFLVVQALESLVITPKVVGDRVGLNALETMLVLIVGGNWGGFAGMLVAIPLGGILKQVLLDCKRAYEKSLGSPYKVL